MEPLAGNGKRKSDVNFQSKKLQFTLGSSFQTSDKGRKRKNLFRRNKIGRDFCFLCHHRLQNAVIYAK